jgi:hypothetical protein
MMPDLDVIRQSWREYAIKKWGKETARKMWEHAVDPVTGYVAKDLNTVDLLDGKTPCCRCGGVGLWSPRGSDRDDHVLCLRCHDDWDEVAMTLLEKHGYVSSKKKWHAAFMEFCETKPK